MASTDIWGKLSNIVLPTTTKSGGSALVPSYDPQQSDQVITALETNMHLRNLLDERVSTEDDDLIETLMTYDPDVSAALGAYLTLSNTEMRYIAKTPEGEIDSDAIEKISLLITQLTNPIDYSKGFTPARSLRARNEAFRYMLLKRGSISAELVLDDAFGVLDIRNIDSLTLEWYQKENGYLTPVQKVGSDEIDLNIPTFYHARHRQDPSKPYSKSSFIAVINTVYARLQIINDLYNIMQITGYPRMTVKVMEEVATRGLPEHDKRDPKKRKAHLDSVIGDVTRRFASIRADQPVVHTDSVDVDTLNMPNGATGIDIQPVINVLNAQNQAALKSVATVLGRGESGVNTASVESMIFSMQASEINDPIAEVWSNLLTFALRLSGSTSYVKVYFDKPEMRPPNELEPAKVQKQTRLQKDLSLGLITDDEYHWEMYNRPKPSSAPELSGTGFLENQNETSSEANATTNTPQKDQPNSRQRAQTKKADASANSNSVK